MPCWTISSGITSQPALAVALALWAPSIWKIRGAGHDLLGLGRVDEGAVHVHVAVEDVVLRVLVGAVDALLGEEDGDLGPGHAGDVASGS